MIKSMLQERDSYGSNSMNGSAVKGYKNSSTLEMDPVSCGVAHSQFLTVLSPLSSQENTSLHSRLQS